MCNELNSTPLKKKPKKKKKTKTKQNPQLNLKRSSGSECVRACVRVCVCVKQRGGNNNSINNNNNTAVATQGGVERSSGRHVHGLDLLLEVDIGDEGEKLVERVLVEVCAVTSGGQEAQGAFKCPRAACDEGRHCKRVIVLAHNDVFAAAKRTAAVKVAAPKRRTQKHTHTNKKQTNKTKHQVVGEGELMQWCGCAGGVLFSATQCTKRQKQNETKKQNKNKTKQIQQQQTSTRGLLVC